jgi:hypothetical protein
MEVRELSLKEFGKIGTRLYLETRGRLGCQVGWKIGTQMSKVQASR